VRPRKKWDSIEQYIEFLRHFMAYNYAKKFVKGKIVLEIGCGTGYGAHYLSRFASDIIAIDISRLCVMHCHNKYKKGKLNFLQGSGLSIPLKDSSIDVALSFQVIEHIEPREVEDYLLEIKRALTNKGVFVVSTPNKKLRLLPFQKPWNPEHKKEYNFTEFKKALMNVFENVKVYGLKGSEEIQSIERNRVKQNPFEVYVIKLLIFLAKKMLPPIIASHFRKVRRSLRNQMKESRSISNEITKRIRISDFKVLSYCPKDCLDFYGACQKLQE
jgi:ubiquinone/menaquinone biosynthesis C-methylase UbiE